MIINYLADSMIKPGNSPVFDDPRNFGLEYENVTLEASDGVKLSGWLIKGGTDKVIIQSHFGVQSSRSGFTPEGKSRPKMWDENISFLKIAKHMVERGYSMLMYDFRNHGNSDAGTIPWVTWGPEEYKDVLAAVDYISTHQDYTNSDIGLLSICMGASSTAFAYGTENGLKNYSNIKAQMAVQPLRYADFLGALGIPDWIARRVNRETEARTGLDLTKSFFPNIKAINVPTLVIQNENDPWASLDGVKQYYDELTVEKEIVWVELARKRAASYDYLAESPDKVSAFFGKHM